jgi:NtrC-family two-component system response regulator AlgB
MCERDTIDLEHLPPNLITTGANGKHVDFGRYQIGDLVPLEVIEEMHIRRVLASAKTLRRAAAVLGVNASALCRKMKRLDMENLSNDQPPE